MESTAATPADGDSRSIVPSGVADDGAASAPRDGRRTAPSTRSRPTDLRERIGGRLMVVTGEDAGRYAPLISASRSGLVVGGKNAAETVRHLALADPTRVLAVDPWLTYTEYASADRPFIFAIADDDQGSLFDAPTAEEALSNYLASQIASGVTFAVTPTGVIQAGDNRALRAAVVAINSIERNDVVFLAPLTPACLNADNLASTIGILARCTHPVAISIADRNRDPYSKVLPALRQLVNALEFAVIWRTDFAGLDLMAHGAKACCIGAIPSKRAADTPGEKRFSSDKRDMHPQVLRQELLRFVKTTFMVDNWYASTESPGCSCVVCGGRKVDRYGDDETSRLTAHRHNVAVLMDLIETVPDPVGAVAWWAAVVADAIAEHISLGATIGGQVKVPASLEAYGRP